MQACYTEWKPHGLGVSPLARKKANTIGLHLAIAGGAACHELALILLLPVRIKNHFFDFITGKQSFSHIANSHQKQTENYKTKKQCLSQNDDHIAGSY